MSTDLYLKLISNCVSKVVSEPSFVDRRTTTKINSDQNDYSKQILVKNLCEFTEAKRFLKRNTTNFVYITEQFRTSQGLVFEAFRKRTKNAKKQSRFRDPSPRLRQSVEILGGKIIVWLSQIYTKICALIFFLDINGTE